MSRTSFEKVKAILGSHYDDSLSLAAFIDTASALVSKLEAADTQSVLSAVDLELIERWLSAHFYAHADQIAQSRNVGRASVSYQGQTAMMFESTQYGQVALSLDATGYLAKRQQEAENGGPSRAGMVWLGQRYRGDSSERSTDQ